MITMTRKPKSLKRMLGTAVLRSVFLVACVGAGAGVASTMEPTIDAVAPEAGASVMDNRPAAKGSPAELVEKHDCWTGEPPADMVGVIPGHVVVTQGVAPVYGGDKLVGQALEQLFDGKDHGLTVHGFCR